LWFIEKMLWRRALWLLAPLDLDVGNWTSMRPMRFLEDDLDPPAGVGVVP